MEQETLKNQDYAQVGIGAVRRSLFGIKYLYIENTTRVRYGLSLKHLGITYKLQRKGIIWYDVAWTYPSTHFNQTLDRIIEYLKWYEQNKKQREPECLF